MRQEEQDSKNNFSKGDRDIEDSGDENIIASAVNSNNTPWCKEIMHQQLCFNILN